MKVVPLRDAKARLSELVDEVSRGEAFVITRYGKPVATLIGLGSPESRELGFHPIAFESDLLEPTHDGVLDTFHGG